MTLFYMLIFVFGSIIGSFLNVVILRLNKKESIFKKRSYCVFCKKRLAWYELFPIFSFLIQKGKCRKCKKNISWQYILVEIATGLMFLLVVVYFFNFTFFSIINICFLFLISCFLLVIFVYDFKYYLVPNEFIYPAIIITFLYAVFSTQYSAYSINWLGFLDKILAGVVGGVFFLIIILISRGKWMGMGDAKIGFLMGLLLGLAKLITALFLSFLIGAIISVILLLFRKKKLKSEIPFAPFLTTSTFIVFLWGNILIDWYLRLFL